MFAWLRTALVVLLLIGAPIFIYLAFFASEPVMEVEYDVDLGMQSVESINSDPEQYPILSEEDYPEAYAYLRDLILEVAASDDIQYRDVFDYSTVKIIHDDKTLNAFCTPGGFIYVYTGLIQYLDAEDHLAGVARAELRQRTDDRHPHQQCSNKDAQVYEVVEDAIFDREVHDSGQVRQRDENVEEHRRGNRPGQSAHPHSAAAVGTDD